MGEDADPLFEPSQVFREWLELVDMNGTMGLRTYPDETGPFTQVRMVFSFDHDSGPVLYRLAFGEL